MHTKDCHSKSILKIRKLLDRGTDIRYTQDSDHQKAVIKIRGVDM